MQPHHHYGVTSITTNTTTTSRSLPESTTTAAPVRARARRRQPGAPQHGGATQGHHRATAHPAPPATWAHPAPPRHGTSHNHNHDTFKLWSAIHVSLTCGPRALFRYTSFCGTKLKKILVLVGPRRTEVRFLNIAMSCFGGSGWIQICSKNIHAQLKLVEKTWYDDAEDLYLSGAQKLSIPFGTQNTESVLTGSWHQHSLTGIRSARMALAMPWL